MLIEDFLDLVKNADKYSAHIKELEEKTQHLKEVSEQYGTLAEANQIKAEAQRILEQAKAEAYSIVEQAKDAEKVRKELLDKEFKEVQAQRRVAGDIRHQGEQALKKAEAILAEVAVKEKGLAKEKALLEAHKEEVAKLKAEYEEKLSVIKSVLK